jgi:hypothetical protein
LDDPLVAEAGEVAEAPEEDEVYVSDVDTGGGDIGTFIEWQNQRDCWMLAEDVDSFVLIDNYR